MDRRDDLPERMPLPSEDEGDLTDEPGEGESTDPLVATEEGVPYVPPTERVLSEARFDEGGSDVAGAPPSDEQELELEPASDVEPERALRDEALLAEALATLRRSDLTAGDRVQVDAADHTIWVRGEVESVDIADEVLALLGELPGVDEVVDELEIAGT
jgi:hypothetical protein